MNGATDIAQDKNKIIKSWSAPIALAACIAALPAHATLITFDDVSAAPICEEEEQINCAPPQLGNQYAHLGVLFSGGASIAGPESPAGNNVLTDWWGPGLTIQFTGALPTFVSMEISTLWEQSTYVDIYSVGAYLTTLVTDGWRGTEETSTPYQPNQVVAFSGAEIASLNIGELFNRRGSLSIDNLRFEYGPNAVPEPNTLVLILGGLLASLFARSIAPRRFL